MFVRSLLTALLLLGSTAHAGVTVRITGLGEDERRNVEAWLGYAEAEERGPLDEQRVRELHAGAALAVQKAMQPYGWYRARLVQSQLEGAGPVWRADYQISAGEPALWSAPDIVFDGEGANSPALAAAITQLPLNQDRRARHALYEETKIALVSAARDDGYPDARLTRSILAVDLVANTAQPQLTLETGARYSFGAIRFEGGEQLRESVLRRYLRFAEGEPYAPKPLLATQFALADNDWFDSVELLPQREQVQDRRIPVLIRLKPRARRHDDYGIGYGTDTGARISAATEFRRLNRRGDKLRAELRLSEKVSALVGEWRIPQGRVPGEYLSFTGEAKLDRYSAGVETRSYKLGTALNRTLGSWRRRWYLDFSRSIVQSLAVDGGALTLAGESNLLTPGLSLDRAALDDAIYARRGWTLFSDLHGAQQGILSDASFLQGRALLRGALPLGRHGRVLARLELGATVVADYSQLPPDQRFFAGGDQSVRGYGYRSLGATSGNGVVIGGKHLNVFSLEVEQRLFGPWGIAGFWDAGGAGDDPGPKLHHGLGLGARYRTAFGTVQIDLAHPLDQGASPVRLHLGIRVGL